MINLFQERERARIDSCNVKQLVALYLWGRTLFVFHRNLEKCTLYCIHIRTWPSFN